LAFYWSFKSNYRDGAVSTVNGKLEAKNPNQVKFVNCQ